MVGAPSRHKPCGLVLLDAAQRQRQRLHGLVTHVPAGPFRCRDRGADAASFCRGRVMPEGALAALTSRAGRCSAYGRGWSPASRRCKPTSQWCRWSTAHGCTRPSPSWSRHSTATQSIAVGARRLLLARWGPVVAARSSPVTLGLEELFAACFSPTCR